MLIQIHHVYGLIPIAFRGIYLTYFTILFLKDLYKMENTCVCLNIIEIEHFRSLFYHDSIIKTFSKGEQSTCLATCTLTSLSQKRKMKVTKLWDFDKVLRKVLWRPQGSVCFVFFGRFLRVSMGWWLLRLSAKILALLRLSVNFFQLRLTNKLTINLFCFKKLNIN